MTSIRSRLAHLLNVHPGEGRIVRDILTLAFLMAVARVYFFSSSNALFLEAFDASAYSYVYIATGAVLFLWGAMYEWLKDSMSFRALLLGILVFLIVTIWGLYFGLILTDSQWFVGLLPVWFGVVWILGWVALWGLANRLFTIQQAKRLFGVIGGSEVLGHMLGGLSIAPALVFLETEHLVFGSGGILLGALVLIDRITRRYSESLQAQAAEPKATLGYRSLLQDRYILKIVLLSSHVYVAYYVVDLMYFTEVQWRFPVADDSAAFLGQVSALIGLVSVVFRTFLSGRILNYFGLPIGLLSLPVTVLASMVFVAVVGEAQGQTQMVFWIVIGVVVAWGILQGGLDKPGTLILYQPLSPPRRTSAQVMVETVFDPLAIAFAGVLLLLFSAMPQFGIPGLAALTAVIGVTWTVLAYRLIRDYPDTLWQSITKRRFGDGMSPVTDATSLGKVAEGLRSPHVDELIYCLNRLGDTHPKRVKPELSGMLKHPSRDVRLTALEWVERLGVRSAQEEVTRFVEREDNPCLRAYGLRTLAAVDLQAAYPGLLACLDESDPQARQTAMVALFRYGGIDGVVTAGIRFKALQESESESDRIVAARILGEVANASFYHPLEELLQDTNVNVRKTALVAARRLGHSTLRPLIVRQLRDPSVRAEAINAVVANATEKDAPETMSSVVSLIEAFKAPDADTSTRVSVVQALRRIGSRESLLFFLKHAAFEDGAVRTAILRAIGASNHRPTRSELQIIDEQLLRETADALWLFQAVSDSSTSKEADLVTSALRRDLQRAQERVAHLLAFHYNEWSLLTGFRQLSSADEAKRAYAVALFEHILDREHRDAILPALLAQDLRSIPNNLPKKHGIFPMSVEERLVAVARRSIAWLSPWSRACAVYTIGRLQIPKGGEIILSLLDDPHGVVRETAVWAAHSLKLRILEPASARLLRDPSRMVQQIARITLTTPPTEATP